MDLVSIIIPYYKKKKFIDKTVSSIINQTYKNLEIIIIYDDEDTSDLEFISEIQKKDKRIIIIKNLRNEGAGNSRNIGIKKANGKYIAFIDSDDTWQKNKLQKQINFMHKNNINASHTSYYIVDDKDKILGKRVAKNFFLLKELLKSCDIGLSTVIIKKNLISDEIKFPNLKTKEDFVLWLKLLQNNNKIYALDEYLTFWTNSPNSLSSSTYQKLLDGFKVYNKYMNFNLIKSLYLLLCLSVNFILKK
tara:strand:+ start:642 stop:1385 length:744 start_codon:yes stop_codon:yes gene_type:complete